MAVPLAVVAFSGDEEQQPLLAVDTQRCRGLLVDAARACWTQSFATVVADRGDPRPAVAEIERVVRSEGGDVLESCHGVMHTVGRTYALERDATLADLQDYLPRSNDPGCSAGFAHGLVTGVAPSIDVRQPREAAEVCADGGTRYQRYSCIHGLGHAFMRLHSDRVDPALGLCRGLGPGSAPDCAQGAFHDYWFAVVGLDDATLPGAPVTDPRELCGEQSPEFVRPCWYRAFVDNRPAGIAVDSADHLDVLCAGLAGLQREACITAAAVIGPADPAQQLEICTALPDAADAASCVRGTKVQNLLGASVDDFVGLIGGCARFEPGPRSACYRWLGKTITVVTDGAFAASGCPQLEGEARRDCTTGAASVEGALVTFS